MRGQSKPPPACSDNRSKPCSRQSSCSVTTTAAMHTLPWICTRIRRCSVASDQQNRCYAIDPNPFSFTFAIANTR